MTTVAGILDKNGGFRVVVTYKFSIDAHVNAGDRVFIVPGMNDVIIPVDDAPGLIDAVQKHVTRELVPINHCGECMACCHVLPIDEPELKKPAGVWCHNCRAGFGCKIYPIAPKLCRTWRCWWRASQERNDRMSPELRPDRCGAIFSDEVSTPSGPKNGIIECHGKPNADAWRWIENMQAAGYKVKEITHYGARRRNL